MKEHIPGNGEAGAVLLIMVLVITMAGIVMLLSMGIFNTQDSADRVIRTEERQNFLIDELAAYVQRENKLPCPADPSVNRTTRGFGFARATCTAATAEGIVPFRTLNLAERDAIDGWGRFMTYRISPVLADLTLGTQIHEKCRRLIWAENSPTAAPYNVNPRKAHYCCPPLDPGNDLIIRDAANNILGGLVARANDGRYSTANDITGYTALPATPGYQDLFAVAIISHGANGAGAYVANTSMTRMPASGNVLEAENYDNDNTVISAPINHVAGATFFDDIVIWRTQTTLMGELNGATCFLPWR